MTNEIHARRRNKSSMIIGVIALGSIAAFLILRGHGYHLLAYAPLLILLACPFLHMSMHGGHGGHGSGGHRHGPANDASEPPRDKA